MPVLAWLIAKWAIARADLKLVPRWAWIAAAVGAMLLGGYIVHQRRATAVMKAAVVKAVSDRDAQWRASLAKVRAKALADRASFERQSAQTNKELNDENARLRARIADDAHRLQDFGPGAAACRGQLDHSGLSGSAGTNRPGAPGSTPLAPLSGGEGAVLFGLPPASAVALAASHDALRAYYLTDREWHRRFEAAWEAWHSPIPKRAVPKPDVGGASTSLPRRSPRA